MRTKINLQNKIMKKSDWKRAINKAKEIIIALYIEEPTDIDVNAIAAMRGAYIKEDALKTAEGRLTILGAHGLITVNSTIPEQGKKRFVTAHELGHFELHRGEAFTISCKDTDFSEWGKNKILETEANYFAAELLMPENIFRRKINNKPLSRDLLSYLAEEFQTTLTATSIRFVILTEEYAMICSDRSGIKWFVTGDEFPYRLNVAGRVHSESLAYDFFDGKSLPDSFWPVSSEAWIDDYKFKGNGEVMEMVIPISTYNQVLSFIRVDIKDDYEEDEYCRELDGRPRFS